MKKNSFLENLQRSRYIRKRIKTLKAAIDKYENIININLSRGDVEYAKLCDKKIVSMCAEIEKLRKERK